MPLFPSSRSGSAITPSIHAAKKFLDGLPGRLLLLQPLPGIMTTARPDGACLIAATTAKTHSAEILRFSPEKERAQGRIIADLIGQIPIPGPRGYAAKDFIRLFSSGNRRRSNTSPQTWVIGSLLRPCAGRRRHRIFYLSLPPYR